MTRVNNLLITKHKQRGCRQREPILVTKDKQVFAFTTFFVFYRIVKVYKGKTQFIAFYCINKKREPKVSCVTS